MSSFIKFVYPFLAITVLGGGGTAIALSTQSFKNQETPSFQAVLTRSTVTEASLPRATQPADLSLKPALEEAEDTQLPETGNCQFITFTFAKTLNLNIPVAFHVTEKDYFSVMCERKVESILPEENWIGFFPKNFFLINHEKINEDSRVDIKVEDIPETDSLYEQSEDDSLWFGIKISSSKLKGNQSLVAKLNYYSGDSSWAEITPTSLDEKIYFLLTQSGEEEED